MTSPHSLESLIEKLKEAAGKATPPQWIVDKNNHQVWSTRNERVLFDFRAYDDGIYIALANPSNILALLEDRARLAEELDRLKQENEVLQKFKMLLDAQADIKRGIYP